MSLKNVCLSCASAAALGFAPVAAAPVVSDEIIVTASPLGRSGAETIIGTSVVTGEELQRSLENSIGETLRRKPGISSSFFGPGASRPIIRGLGGDRISVLDSGIGSIDASATSPDHAVAVEPATAERIEIVRGTGTLLYGSSAAGGVVNVFSGRIPRSAPDGGVDGGLRIGKSTVDDGTEASGGFDVKLFDAGDGAFVFHGEGFYRKADDYKIPGFAESLILHESEGGGPRDDEEQGLAENSAFETKGGAAGLSYVFGDGFFGFSGTAINTRYGVPGGHGHEDEDEDEEEEGGVSIELKQRRLDFDSEIERDFLLFKKVKLRLGFADYEHTELEPDGAIGTIFTNEGWEGRLELVDKTVDLGGAELNGALGFQFKHRDFSAIGEEAFVPPTSTNQYGVFGLKELSTGAWRFEIGGRYESTKHDAPDLFIERKFDAFSVSGGIGLSPTDETFIGVTGYRTERAPSTEELFSDGPHLATGTFEVGDPTLGKEVGRGLEATARYDAERFSIAVNGFYTSYRDFIFEIDTVLEEDELPVFQFVADDATFKGFEAEVHAELFGVGAFDVHADASADYVRAKTESGNLPRIPPFSALFGLEARSALFDLRGEAELAARQNRTAEFELPTEGYTVYNAFLTVRPFATASGLAVRVIATNLTNEEVRLHTSFLKDLVPLPGRNVKVALTGSF